MLNGFAVLYTSMQKAGYFYKPFFSFGFHLVFIVYSNGFRSLAGIALVLYFSFFTGFCRLAAGYKAE